MYIAEYLVVTCQIWRVKVDFCGSFLLFMLRVCLVFLSVHCSLVFTCCERADLSALLYVMFYCVFVTFPCDVLIRYGV